jgi:hypothetical protein
MTHPRMPAAQTTDMSVPLLDLQAQYAPLRGDILAAIERVCDSQRFILGPEVEALERDLGSLLEVGPGLINDQFVFLRIDLQKLVAFLHQLIIGDIHLGEPTRNIC